MSCREATQLVIQAASMGTGRECFILNMGADIKIVDLAHNLITLSGLTPDKDIEIKFTGLRPGEKLHETLYTKAEQVRQTSHASILVATEEPPVPAPELEVVLDELERLARDRRLAELHDLLAWVTARQQVQRSEEP